MPKPNMKRFFETPLETKTAFARLPICQTNELMAPLQQQSVRIDARTSAAAALWANAHYLCRLLDAKDVSGSINLIRVSSGGNDSELV